MTIIQSAVKALASKFLPEADLKEVLSEKRSYETVANEAIGFFKKEASLLPKGSRSYDAAIKAAEDLLVVHHDSTSFAHLCRSLVRKLSKPNYYHIATIGKVIDDHNREVGTTSTVVGGEAGLMLAAIKDAITEAKVESNFIKRRSIVRKAIISYLPGISSDRAALLTELALVV